MFEILLDTGASRKKRRNSPRKRIGDNAAKKSGPRRKPRRKGGSAANARRRRGPVDVNTYVNYYTKFSIIPQECLRKAAGAAKGGEAWRAVLEKGSVRNGKKKLKKTLPSKHLQPKKSFFLLQ